MSGAVTAAAITAAVAVGTTAYTARQNRKAEARGEAAAEKANRAAAKSQTQGSDPVEQFRRRRRSTQGFDSLAMLGAPAAGAPTGGALLGQ